MLIINKIYSKKGWGVLFEVKENIFAAENNDNLRILYWLYLALGIIFEVLGTICMKLAEGFTKLVPSIFVFVFYGLALAALVLVLKKMGEISIVYAIWASAGTALIAVIGMVWFKEPVTPVKIISILLIIFGILGLELFS